MPNKTIYVSDQDLPLFERAQTLAGENLSSTIIQALHQFIQQLELRAKGFRTVDVEVGSVTFTRKRFTGMLIASAYVVEDRRTKKKIVTIMGGRNATEFEGARTLDPLQADEGVSGPVIEMYDIYQTRKGNYALRIRILPRRGQSGAPEQRLEVYAGITELKGHIPDDLYEFLLQSLKGSGIEVLDI